jgi:hypothetical protein
MSKRSFADKRLVHTSPANCPLLCDSTHQCHVRSVCPTTKRAQHSVHQTFRSADHMAPQGRHGHGHARHTTMLRGRVSIIICFNLQSQNKSVYAHQFSCGLFNDAFNISDCTGERIQPAARMPFCDTVSLCMMEKSPDIKKRVMSVSVFGSTYHCEQLFSFFKN